MLEIKPYDDWIANQEEVAEPITNLKNYTDYVRSSYYSAGQLNQETEQEIAAGVADRLKGDGLLTDDMPDDVKNNLYSSVVGATRNENTDARFVLDYLRTNSEGPANIVANEAKASNLETYLTLLEKSPSEAEGFKPYVDEILADKSLVKRARMSAVDRGEYSIAALDEEDGTRSLYAGANARPESIAGEVKSLIATGALSSADLYRVNDFVKPLNGGLTNGAEDSRYEMFQRTVSDLAKTDKDLNKLIEKNASDKMEQKTAELRTTGETILEGAKTVISYPFIKGSEILVDLFDGEEKQPKYAPDTTLADALAGNSAFNQRFSAAEIEKFSDALTDKVAGAPYRADRPETGITTDSMGNVILAPSLLANVEQFNQAVSRSSLNKDQQKQASTQRKLLLESAAPDLIKMILEEEPEAVSSYAKAKADGLTPSEFIEQYVGSGKDYSAFGTRLEQFGKSAWKTLAEIPLGIAALAGNEWAATTMGDMMKDQTRRQEFSRLFGDEYGFGFQLLNTLPQVATDIGLTIGTAGAFAGAKTLAKTGAASARSMIRNGAKMALSEIDDAAAASFRKAASAEGSQFLGKAITDVGESFGKKFGELAPLAAVTFTRSAGSAFGSLYNQLPDDMSHEEKYKNALPAALAMGVSTSVITVGLSGMGLGAVEDIGTNAIRKIRGGDTVTTRSALEAAERAVPVSKMNYRQAKQVYQNVANEGRVLSDAAFNTAARAAITSTYKNWLKTTLKGGLSEAFEESLDQAVGMAIENAALDRDTSLAEKVAQVFDAGLLGGALGAGIAGSTQFGRVRKSEQSLVFEGRASAFEDIANRLRKNNSNSTADVLQRRIDEAREQARLSVERDIAAQKTQEDIKVRTVVANPNERPLKGRPVFNEETGQWAPADEPFDPLLNDILGEEIEYSGFSGVLELDPEGNSINLRLNKPYTTDGGGVVEFINLGPRFQRASKFTAPILTISEETFGVPAGTPYVTMGSKKTKFAFPVKEKTTPESFEVFRDDEGNVRSLIVKGGVSLKDGSSTMNIPLTNSLQIKAIAEWYGIDIAPKAPVLETPEGQFEFGFANRKDLIKSKEEFGFVAPSEPEMTDEELQAETEDILGRSFAPVMEGEMELVTDKQNRTRRILEGFDAQISSKQKNLKKVTDTLAPLKDLSDKQLTEDQKLIKKQSIGLEKTLKKEIAELKKNKKGFSGDAIELASTATQEPLTAAEQGPRVYRSWDESQKQLDRDFAESINEIRQRYVDSDAPVDVDRIENIVRILPLRNKLGTSIGLSDVSIQELDAVESMAEDIIGFAEDTDNKATPKQRELIINDYRALVARINIIQEYVVEREYEEVFGLAVSELKTLQTESEPEEEVEAKASDKDTLHYLLSNTPEAFTTIDVKPFADKKTLDFLKKKMGVEVDEKRRDSVETVTVKGYDQDTREIIYEKLGVEMRAPLSTVDFEVPTLRTAIDEASAGVFAVMQQAKKEAAAIKRRTSRPVQDRVRDFLVAVNNYVVKSKELDARLEQTKNLPATKRSAAVSRIKGQMKEMRADATKYINRVGSILQSDFDFYKDLEAERKQEMLTQLRNSLFGVGGFREEVAPRARVKAFNPTPDIKVTKVEYAKEQFRNGTQEEDMLNELVEGGFIVNLPETGKTLAQAGLFITESGVNKFPAFSQSQVEVVEQEGQEVANTNTYIKDKHELLSERVLAKYPQFGGLVTITGRSRTKGTIGEDTATLDSIEVEINRMDSAIERDALLGRKVPSEFIARREALVQQLKDTKVKIKDERYYEIDGEKYEVRNSKTDKSIYFPVDKDGVFGVFTNNPKITKAQIAEGYRVIIPDTFDRDLFNPSQYTRDGRIIEGYYLPRNPEPVTIGSFGRVSNPRVDESGEQILDDRSNFESARIELFVNNMVRTSEIKGDMGKYFATSLSALDKKVRNLLASKRNRDSRFPWSETYIDNTISDLSRGFAAELNEYRLAQNVVRKSLQSLKFQGKIKVGQELVSRFIDEEGNTIDFSDLPQEIRDEVIVDKLKGADLVKFVTEMVDGDVNSIADNIKKIYKNIKGGDPNSVIVQYAKLLYTNATVAGGRFYSLPDPNTYLNRPANLTVVGASTFNTVANRNAKAERADPNTGYVPLDYVNRDGEGFFLEEIIGAEGADTVQALQDEMDRRRQESGSDAGMYDMLLTGESYASALQSSDLVFMNRSALLASELYRTIAEDKTGKLAQVFRDLAVQTEIMPQYQADNLSDAVLVQSLAGVLNTDYILHTNKGYARVVLSTLSGTDLGKQAAGLLIALGWLPPTLSLPLRAPAERKSAAPAATATTPPDEAIAAGKAVRQAEATDQDTIDYANNYLEAAQAALPYLLKLGSERRIALNTIEEARADIFDSFRLLRTLIGKTDPEDMGPVGTKTKRQIAEGIEAGSAGATAESIAAFQDKNVSDIEAEIQKLQDTRSGTENLINGISGVRARIVEIADGLVLRDESGKAIEKTPALLKQAKSKKEKAALKKELAELQKTYADLYYRGDETLADLDASIATKQKQLEKAKAARELSGPELVNSLIENIESAYAQIKDNRVFLSELSESARKRVEEESRRIDRLLKLPEWKQYVEIIAGSPTIQRNRKDTSEAMMRRLDEIERNADLRNKFDEEVRRRKEALDQALIKNGVNLPKSGLLTKYIDPIDVPRKSRFEPSEGQVTDPNVRPVGRPRKTVATFGEENFSAAERKQSTAKAFSEKAAQIAGTEAPESGDLPTREVGGKVKILGKPRSVSDPNYNFSLSQIDPSLRDEAKAENLRVAGQLGLVSGDPNSVLGALRRITQTGTPRQQVIAELLLTAPDFIRNINFVMVELDLGFAGLYDQTSNSVVVNLNEHNGRGLVDVLLHEYLHAPTAKVLLNPKTESQRKAVARIEAIRNFAFANAVKLGLDTDPVVRLGLSSNAEFLTYALTAPEFQNILAGLTPPDQRSILRRLVDAILNVFGLDPKKHQVAADAIQELLDFTKMSLSHSGTFSVDNRLKALVGTATNRNERAQAYSDLVSAELINDVISRYSEGGEGNIFLAEGSAADFEFNVEFTAEERAKWNSLRRAAIKEMEVGVQMDVDALGKDTEGQPWKGVAPKTPERAQEAWRREIFGILKRAGVDQTALNRAASSAVKAIRAGTQNKAQEDVFQLSLASDLFFFFGPYPMMDTNEGRNLELAMPAFGRGENFKEGMRSLYASLSRVGDDAYNQAMVKRLTKAYIEAFAPDSDIDLARKEFDTLLGTNRYIRTGELEGDTAIDVLGEIRRIMPEGINIEINNTMVGAMGANATKPNTILVNENLVSTMASGLSAANARAVVRTAVDEELAHLASFSVFTTDDFAAIAAELGSDKVNEILDMIYSNSVPDATERAARIAADREAGVTGDIDAAAEWVRMEITRLATGRTREADIAFFYTNPSLLERFLEGLKAFINKLKQQFKSEPTAGTAARISQASRSFRKLRNGGTLPTPEPSAANEYGDSTAFLNAVNGDIAEGQEDRTYFMLPVSGTGNSKAAVSGFWKTVQDKMYNLPMELRKYLNMRDGTISQIEYTIQDFDRRFPKMRDAALAGGASIEDIGMILGTTAPVVQGEARKEIQRKVREFKAANAKDPDLERKADDYEAKLTQPEADKFFAAFRKEQKAMETKLKSAGFGDLVDYLVEFRKEINKYKAVINFDESNDVYLTRTFRFFGSEGWASFAKTGGIAMIDGKEVDFNKLRAAAAKHFEWEVNNEAKQTGQTFTAEQHDKKLVEYLDRYLKDLELQAADAKELGAMNTIRKDINRLLNKKDFDAPLRTLLGEVTDPFENAVRTVYNVGRLAANERFLRNFARQAIEIGVASRTREPDMDLLFPPSQSAQLGDLAGLYVRNDIAATIREELGMNGMKQQSKAMEQINTFGRLIAKFSGLSITAKTLGSVGFYPRNVLGGIALTTSQGIVNPVYLKDAMRLSIIANMSLNGKIKPESEETKETRNQIRRLVELQVLKDETRGRIAMDMLNGFVNSTDQQLEELLNDIIEAQGSGNIEKIIKKFKLKGTWEATKQAGGSTVEFLASLNNVIDSAFKLNAYFYELSVLKEAFGDTESESKLEADAARKVKLTFPTHSDQLSLAKAFNKSPFSMVALPFVRWKTEVFRTMFNTIPLAVEEIKSGNPTMRSRGIKRLIGFTTTMAGGSAAYGAIFATLFSLLTDDEEDERDGVRKLTDEELDALRQGLPVWQRNHGIFAQLLQDGSVQVIDMSNILPYSQITDIVGLAARGNLKGIADYLTSEMIGTQIAASTVLELAQNRDDFDQPIWLDTDGAVGASFKMLMHLAKGTVVPSVVDKAMKIGRYGEQNAKEMIVGELTGVRPIIHKVTDIEYRGMRNLKESADAVVSLLYPLSSGKALDPNEVEGIMEDHQSASNKNQQKLHDFLMGMQSIGSTEASLAATAQQMKFSKQRFGAALAGENIPWGPNEQWFRKMYDNKVRVGEQNPDEIASEINRVMSKKADSYNTNFLE